jgi:hypothetical protein
LARGPALLTGTGQSSQWWAAAYLAILRRAPYGVIFPPRRLVLKRIGLLELPYTLLFLLFAPLAFFDELPDPPPIPESLSTAGGSRYNGFHSSKLLGKWKGMQ